MRWVVERGATPQKASKAAPLQRESYKSHVKDEEKLLPTCVHSHGAKSTPKLRAYLPTPIPTWPDIVDTAHWLRHDLGVSKPLWGEACMAMSARRHPSRSRSCRRNQQGISPRRLVAIVMGWSRRPRRVRST